MVSMDRATWEAAGFTPDDRYPSSTSKAGIKIVRAADGVKPKKIGKQTVVLQSRHLGELNYKRTYIHTGPGQILA